MTIQTAVPAPAAAGMGGTLAIEAHDLVKTYPKGVRALDGLSFAVRAGTIFALLGPNGAGKSTTVKILTTLAQADSGTAMVAGWTSGPSLPACAASSGWSRSSAARTRSPPAGRT